MSHRQLVNQEVNVTSFYFRDKKNLKSVPRKIEYNGQEYTFIDSGLELRIINNDQVLSLYNLTDGSFDYKLKHDRSTWTLVSITS